MARKKPVAELTDQCVFSKITEAYFMQTKIDFFDRSSFPDSPGHGYQIKRATGPLLDRVVSMRYRSYSSEGFIDENSSGKFMDEYDALPNCSSHLLYFENKAVGSIRTCVYKPNKPFPVPILEVYGKEIEAAIGLTTPFLEVNKFVIAPEFQKRGGVQARFELFRAVAEETREKGAEYILMAVRKSHVRFYDHMFDCQVISEAKLYPGLKFSTVLLLIKNTESATEFAIQRAHHSLISHEPILSHSAI